MSTVEFRALVWHVHIQWLASIDELDWWLDAIVTDEHRMNYIDPHYNTESHGFSLTEYSPSCPSWSYYGDKMTELTRLWLPIRKKLCSKSNIYRSFPPAYTIYDDIVEDIFS